ncbi:Cof-type HAD-IIB family hydrolase [Clostridium sp. Ade.TY]|uniref:Cof-type HAD-IIB family hydrolase n=1 Tax=Clostridium sp. Ade.TY TaxID=1391647 RepID=UPI00040D3A73|nr:Cof-type HAD-IIB family hydrolase [Clostridium sp. Ade.TY]
MSIKLICIDMDGTLLDNNHNVSNENKEALMEAKEKGVIIAITTGRLFTSAKYYSDLIGIDAPIISSNGAYIREKNSSDVIYENALSLDESLEIYNISKKYSSNGYFNTHDTAISSTDFREDHAYKVTNKNIPEEDRIKFIVSNDLKDILRELEGDVLKFIAIDTDGSNNDELIKAKNEFLNLNKYEVVSSGLHNFEVMKKGTSKGNAVKHLAKILNINRDEIMCIGDSENDLSMIKYAGTGVCMGNGLDLLKKEAQYITDTNINSGVAKAIRKFVL